MNTTTTASTGTLHRPQSLQHRYPGTSNNYNQSFASNSNRFSSNNYFLYLAFGQSIVGSNGVTGTAR